jgi:hypothetical protein
MAGATQDDAILDGEGTTKLMGNNVMRLDTFTEHMVLCTSTTQLGNRGAAARTSALLAFQRLLLN